jgi:hypothetical protein
MHYPEMWGYVQFTGKTVGSTAVPFVQKPEEEAKWFLRKLYYNEKKYFYDHASYTNDLNKLNFTDTISNFSYPPVIENTTNMFEASVISQDGKYKVTINDHGLVSVIPVKK